MEVHRMKRSLLHTVPALAVAAALALVPAAVASADIVVGPGGVVALHGTEHVWVVDAQGSARLAGDLQALARVPVNWSDREEATITELQALPRGAPLLTAGLVQIGGAIYLPEFAAAGGAPTLLHVQSVDDLALIGVTAANYGDVVMDRATWEQRYGFDTGSLPYGEFAMGAAPAAAAPQTTPDYTSGETTATEATTAEPEAPMVITVPDHPDHPNYTVPIPE
jgi:hypothetical protein